MIGRNPKSKPGEYQPGSPEAWTLCRNASLSSPSSRGRGMCWWRCLPPPSTPSMWRYWVRTYFRCDENMKSTINWHETLRINNSKAAQYELTSPIFELGTKYQRLRCGGTGWELQIYGVDSEIFASNLNRWHLFLKQSKIAIGS